MNFLSKATFQELARHAIFVTPGVPRARSVSSPRAPVVDIGDYLPIRSTDTLDNLFNNRPTNDRYQYTSLLVSFADSLSFWYYGL